MDATEQRLTANDKRILGLFALGYTTSINIREPDGARVEIVHPTLAKVVVRASTIRFLRNRHLIGSRSDPRFTRFIDFFAKEEVATDVE